MNWTPEGSSNLRNVCCCGLPFQAEADTNCDEFVDFFDIQPFVDIQPFIDILAN